MGVGEHVDNLALLIGIEIGDRGGRVQFDVEGENVVGFWVNDEIRPRFTVRFDRGNPNISGESWIDCHADYRWEGSRIVTEKHVEILGPLSRPVRRIIATPEVTSVELCDREGHLWEFSNENGELVGITRPELVRYGIFVAIAEPNEGKRSARQIVDPDKEWLDVNEPLPEIPVFETQPSENWDLAREVSAWRDWGRRVNHEAIERGWQDREILVE
jgi:hypothetical protein